MTWLFAYAATVFLANWAITAVGMVPVGFGLLAPAGVYVAGLSFGLRDAVQETLGARWTLAAVALGALLSAFLSPQLALASGAAFLLGELADFAVYTPLRRRNWTGAVVASNAVGSVVDSALFLALAFGSLDFLAGQVVGKWEMVVPGVLAVAWVKRRRAGREGARGE